MTATSNLLVLITLTILGAEIKPEPNVSNILNLCEDKITNSTYKLNPPSAPTKSLFRDEVQTILKIYPKTARVLLVKRDSYTAYCYHGGDLDSNTGCDKTFSYRNPNSKEAIEWNIDKKCPIGYECSPNGNCWGGDSRVCLSSSTEITPKGPEINMHVGKEWMMFAHHTCISSWSCNIKEIQVPLSYYIDESDIKIFYTTNSGQRFHPNDDLKNGRTDEDHWLHTLLSSPPTPKVIHMNAVCFSRDIENIKCITKSNKESNTQGITFNIDYKTMLGINGNMLIQVLGKIKTVNNDTLSTVSNNNGEVIIEKTNPLDFQKAASVMSLQQQMDAVQLIQMQALYNNFELYEWTSSLGSILTRVIERLGKLDEELLAYAIGKHFKTKWINEKTFRIQRCLPNSLPTHTNCINGAIFKNNMLEKAINNKGCYAINESGIENINLLSPIKIDDSIIKEIPIVPSIKDSDTWQWMETLRRKQSDPTLQNQVVNGENFLSYMNSIGMVSWSSIISYVTFMSSFAAWVSLYMSCKRVR